jgi:hypothetical protein
VPSLQNEPVPQFTPLQGSMQPLFWQVWPAGQMPASPQAPATHAPEVQV